MKIADLVTIAEAAKIVGVHRRTINKRIEDGTIEPVKIGPRMFMISRSDAVRYAGSVSNRSNGKRASAAAAAAKAKPRRKSRAK
jgi:excisionase family DNA binding protein